MKVLIVNDEIGSGGTEKLIKDICDYYNRDKIDLYVATLRIGPWDHLIDHKIVKHFYFERLPIKKNFFNKVRRFFFNKRLCKIIPQEFDVCVIYKQLYYDFRDYVNAKKYILWVHEDYEYNLYEPIPNDLKTKLIYCRKRKYLKKFDRIVACSNNTKESYERFYKIKNLSVIQNSINEIEVYNNSLKNNDLPDHIKKNYMVSVSSIFKTKNGYGKRIDLLIELFYRCLQKNDSLKLVIIGDGPYKPDLMKRVAELKIEDKCLFLGNKENPFPYVKDAKIMITASNMESYGLSVAEAMYLGVPAVCFYNRGIQNFITSGENGIIVDNEGQFVEEVLKLNMDLQYRNRLAENAKESMRQLANIKQYVKNFEECVFDIIKD